MNFTGSTPVLGTKKLILLVYLNKFIELLYESLGTTQFLHEEWQASQEEAGLVFISDPITM